LVLIALLVCAQSTYAAVSGNPVADGWTSHGNSLENGVYTRGNGNYGFETYSATLTVDAAMAAATSNAWSAGDTVIGVGGVFASITPGAAGWDAFTGSAVNSLLSVTTGPRIQAKFGTFGPLDNTFTPNGSWGVSSVAPGGGNAIGGLAGGHNGAIQVRGPGYITYSSLNAGQLKPLDGIGGSGSISRWTGSTTATLSDISSARLIYTLDGSGELASWQILLNVTRLSAVSPFAYIPEPGVPALMTVQNNDSGYTDSLLFISSQAAAVPEPTSLSAWAVLALALGGASWRRRKASNN
jgi:hypothetical protein